ncbi:hypothetical protein N5F00_15695 [Pseudomonas chengduensis]|nr:hypothetical protein [Pseudomonas chengduensis]MDH1730938.1 hypothetical protein [Pseudomonas chengduensis]
MIDKELNDEIDRHNDSQERIVARAQDIVKVLLLMSGGALAVCANFFSTGVNLYQHHKLVTPIQIAWVCLTISIVFFALCLAALLARDDRFGQLRAEYLEQRTTAQKEMSPWWERIIWGIGLFGFLMFCVGMSAFCYASWGYLAAQS